MAENKNVISAASAAARLRSMALLKTQVLCTWF